MLPSGGIVPPQPEALPDVSSRPALQSLQPEDRLAYFGQSEVLPPAPHVLLPGIPQFFAGFALTAAPHLPHLRFEALDTLRRYSDPLGAVQSKAQELAFPDPPRTALGGVQLQSQMLLASSPAPRPAYAPPPPGSTMRVLMNFGLRRCQPARRPRPASLPSACPYGRRFATRFFRLHLAATPCGSLRLPSSAPVGSFHPTRFCPCWAHWRTLRVCCVGFEPTSPRGASKIF